MTVLWLVRHGATDWSEARRLTGWRDIPLNERGLAQAKELRAQLAQEKFDSVWSSDLSRASQTASITAGAPQTDQRLREINFGSLEGLMWADLDPVLQQQFIEFDHFEAPNGESVSGLRGRVTEFLDELSEGVHLVVTHGGVIRTLLREIGDDRIVRTGTATRIDYGTSSRLI